MLKKTLSVLVLMVALLFTATACSSNDEGEGLVGGIKDAVNTAVGQYITGEVTGQTGKLYSTQWFTFSVDSIELVEEYAGYLPAEGNQLYDIVVTETSTFDDDPLPMGTFDWVMDENSWADYIDPLLPLEGRDEMMPEMFELPYQETVTYHMLFEVPVTETGLKLIYHEIDENDELGVTFTINVN